MERFRLKNVIILILVFANLFLLASLLMRKSAEAESRQQATEQLVALFAADNIRLDPSLVSYQTPPSSKYLIRTPEREQAAAMFFLGSSLVYADQGGDIYTYTGSNGAAMFRSTGSFDIAGTLTTSSEDAQELCRRFCKEFSYSEPQFQINAQGNGTGTAICQFSDLAVYNCSVTFTIQNNILTMVSGTLLPENHTDVTAKISSLSASAALTTFQQFRRENGGVVSAVSDLYLSYELQSTPTSAMTLIPSWCIVTDTVQYYVNCGTGSIRVP